jgi:PAS domain S-box-containing protein
MTEPVAENSVKASLRKRALMVFIVLGLGPIIVTAIITGRISYSINEAQNQSLRQLTLQRVTDNIGLYLKKVEDDIHFLDRVVGIAELGNHQQYETMSAFMLSSKRYQSATLFDAAGNTLVNVSRSNPLNEKLKHIPDLVKKYGFLESNKELHFGSIRFDPNLREPLVTIAGALINRRTGDLAYILSFELRFKAIWDLLATIGLDQSMVAYLTDGEGIVVAHHNPTIVLSKRKIQLDGESSQIGINGKPVVRNIERVPSSGGALMVVVEQPKLVALAPTRKSTKVVALVSIFALCLIWLIYLYFSRAIIAPIESLARSARSLSRGTFPDKILVNNFGEVADLTYAFNEMVVDLKESWEENKRATNQLKQMVIEQKRTENDLRESELHLKEIIWGTNVGTWEWNIQTGETKYNDRWAEIIGYTLEELEPINFDAGRVYFHPDDLKKSREMLDKHFSRELDHYESEVRMRHKNGEWVWVIDRGTVVEWTEEGEPLRMSGTHNDISERKKLDQMKSEFVSTVSHELRTPLTSIKGSLALLVDGALGNLPDNVMEMVNMAYRNTNRLIVLINDILDMEQILSGSIKYNFQQLSLSNLVEEAVKSNSGYATEHGVEFVLTDLDPKVRVLADSSRLTQVVANLLSNAAKFSNKGEKVEISVAHHTGVAKVSILDRGRGIPENFRDQIFGRFTQADSSDSREKGGTGLGLNISKSIIEKHDGMLDFESEVGVGSTFFFTLPISV